MTRAATDETPRAVYLYSLVRSPGPPALEGAPPGPPGASPPRALALGDGLWLVAADVPLPQYGAEEIQRRLDGDLSWVSSCALAHEAVVEHAAGAGPVVPMKLFTLFASDERAVAHIRAERPRLERVLERVAGAAEWGVRVRFDPSRAKDTEEGSSAPSSSGTAFLVRKKRAQEAAKTLAARARVAADEAYAALAAGAAAARRREPLASEAGARLLLDAAFLVEGERAAAFEAEVARAAERVAGVACELTLTGPWPPYNFVEEAP